MTKKKHTPDGKNFSIIGETPNINYFLKTSLTPDSVGGVVNDTTTRKESKVRRYVGDPTPFTRPGGPMRYMYDPGRIDLQTLPGRSFILDDGTEKRQFTLVGDVMDLHAFLVTEAKADLKLYTQGAPYVIAAAGGGQEAAGKSR